MPGDVQVLGIPYGSLLVFRGVSPEEAERIEGMVRAVTEHQQYGIVFLPAEGDAASLSADEVMTALRSTMADEVADEVLERASTEARSVANEVVGEVRAAKAEVVTQAVDAAQAAAAETARALIPETPAEDSP